MGKLKTVKPETETFSKGTIKPKRGRPTIVIKKNEAALTVEQIKAEKQRLASLNYRRNKAAKDENCLKSIEKLINENAKLECIKKEILEVSSQLKKLIHNTSSNGHMVTAVASDEHNIPMYSNDDKFMQDINLDDMIDIESYKNALNQLESAHQTIAEEELGSKTFRTSDEIRLTSTNDLTFVTFEKNISSTKEIYGNNDLNIENNGCFNYQIENLSDEIARLEDCINDESILKKPLSEQDKAEIKILGDNLKKSAMAIYVIK